MSAARELVIGGVAVAPGSQATVDLPVTMLYTHTPVHMPVRVVRGRRDGPTLFVSAAIHGDEINGVEIIRRVLESRAVRRLRGTLICVPVVNVFGFLNRSRYLPDGRDLNRSFPGSERGSLAARLASLFLDEVVAHATHGIDLHTGSGHRCNLPQVRADLSDERTLTLARAFEVPVLLDTRLRDGSLRAAAAERGLPMLLYEAGEALRFSPAAVHAGVRGVIAVMRTLGMLPPSRRRRPLAEPVVARSSVWVRAPSSGVMRMLVPLGARVERGQTLGVIAHPFGETAEDVAAPCRGIVIGRSDLPLVHEGDALVHIARFERTADAAEQVEAFQAAIAELGPEDYPPSIADIDAGAR